MSLHIWMYFFLFNSCVSISQYDSTNSLSFFFLRDPNVFHVVQLSLYITSIYKFFVYINFVLLNLKPGVL